MRKEIWGDFEVYLDQVVGKGAMGTVFKGRQISIDRPAAIKVLGSEFCNDPEFTKRFLREIKIVAKLDNTHVIQVFGAGEKDGRPFFAMQYVDGESLESRLNRRGRLTQSETVVIGIHVAEALKAAWEAGIVHRDIKPSNIMLQRSVRDETVELSHLDKEWPRKDVERARADWHFKAKVMDFGIAKTVETQRGLTLTMTGRIMGTPLYMAPEQWQGQPCDCRTDIYALGGVMYRLLTGRMVFDCKTPGDLMRHHVNIMPVPPKKLNPMVDERLQAIVMRCLRKNPNERYPDPDALLKDLRAVQQGQSISQETVLLTEQLVSTKRRKNPVPMFAGIGLLVAVISALVFLFMPRELSDDERSVPRRGGVDDTSILDGTAVPGGGADQNEAKKKVQMLVSEGKKLLDRQKYRDALVQFERALELDGENAEAREGYDLAVAKIQEEEASALREKRYSDHMKWGNDALALEKWDMALKYFHKAREEKDTEEVRELIAMANYWKLSRDAEEQEKAGEIRTALERYREAFKHRNTEEVRKKIGELSCAIAISEGEAKERKADFHGALVNYREAEKNISFLVNRKDHLLERITFCEEIIRALDLGGTDDIESIIAAKEILKSIRGRALDREWVSDRIREHESKINEAYAVMIAEVREHLARFDWEAALEGAERALKLKPDDREASVLRDEARIGVAAPPNMLYIPGGTFLMGSNSGNENEAPVHSVEVAPFYIDMNEVTNAQYAEFLNDIMACGGHNPEWCHPDEPAGTCHKPEYWDDERWNQPDRPVVGVSWYDAYAFARWAGKRLPTEAEWEKAASWDPVKVEKRDYPWGNEFDVARCVVGVNKPAPVGSKPEGQSAYGCLDMAGNVWEWVDDWYDLYPGSSAAFGFKKRYKVLRGGAWGSRADLDKVTRCTYRRYELPEHRSRLVGFRCASDIDK